MENLLEILRFKDGYGAYILNKDREHHFTTRPGEVLTFGEGAFTEAPTIKYKDMKVTYSWWRQRWGKT